MAIRKNNRKQFPRPRIRVTKPVDEDFEMAAFDRQLQAMSEILAMLPDDPSPEAVRDAATRWGLRRVLDAVAESGNDNYLMLKAAPALEALSDGPLSETAHTFLALLCSHLPNPGIAH